MFLSDDKIRNSSEVELGALLGVLEKERAEVGLSEARANIDVLSDKVRDEIIRKRLERLKQKGKQ